MSDRPPVAVIGAGLSGLAAAEALQRAGRSVVVVEQHRLPGGRAGGFRDPTTGWLLENGQHVWMPCCTALMGLLRRTGAEELVEVQRRLEVTYVERGRSPAVLKALPLPTPFHLLLPLITFPLLARADTSALLRALVALRVSGRGLERNGADRLLIDWLRDRRQTPQALEVFWRPAITSILNVELETARLDLAVMAIRTAFLAGSRSANITRTRVPQTRVWERVMGHLRERGAEIRMNARVEALTASPGRVDGIVLADGDRVDVGGVVLALPPSASNRLLATLGDEGDRGGDLTWSPILNLHVWFEEAVVDQEVTCLVGSPLHWVFRKPAQEPEGGSAPVPSSAQHLNLVVSASDAYLGRSPQEAKKDLLDALADHLPELRTTRVIFSRLVHEHRATFRAVPGSEAARTGPAGPIDGIARAGDWTTTGWPSTLEGAVRSGQAAARHLSVNSG